MPRFFNTAGPVNACDHYCLPPLHRFDLADVLRLIEQKKYFVLHAPRQTGKTSSLLALQTHLNAGGRYRCLYCNVEVAQAAREDIASGDASDSVGNRPPRRHCAGVNRLRRKRNSGSSLGAAILHRLRRKDELY